MVSDDLLREHSSLVSGRCRPASLTAVAGNVTGSGAVVAGHCPSRSLWLVYLSLSKDLFSTGRAFRPGYLFIGVWLRYSWKLSIDSILGLSLPFSFFLCCVARNLSAAIKTRIVLERTPAIPSQRI